MKTKEQNTVTITVTAANVYELFQLVYEQASNEVVCVFIDIQGLTALIVLKVNDG